jgi:hypothetical protein
LVIELFCTKISRHNLSKKQEKSNGLYFPTFGENLDGSCKIKKATWIDGF